jgi:hypothetical protein
MLCMLNLNGKQFRYSSIPLGEMYSGFVFSGENTLLFNWNPADVVQLCKYRAGEMPHTYTVVVDAKEEYVWPSLYSGR